ncbi:MAG: sensor histidine kinase [Nocardioides sp.]
MAALGSTSHRDAASRDAASPRAVAAPGALTFAAWLIGLVTTLLILDTPYLVFGFHSPSLHLVLDSVDACIAFLLAFLLYGRLSRTRRPQDVLLTQAFLLLGISGLPIPLLLDELDRTPPRTLEVWLPLTLRALAALLLVTAAALGSRPASRTRRRWLGWAPALLAAASILALRLTRHALPPAIAPNPPASAQHPVVDGHWLLITAQAFAALCFLTASVLFMRQATRQDDALVRWLGPACALGGFARVNYVLFPSLYSSWVYTGDILRTSCYLLLLVAAAREIGQYWSAQSRLAILEDRRRLARELHDGVVQELGYIRGESFRLQSDPEVQRRIQGACDRALDEARAALDALGPGAHEPLGRVLHRAAREVATRYGDAHVDVDLDDSIEVDVQQVHALVRLTREAVSNAVRHGTARTIHIRLERYDAARRLVITDDGHGFDQHAAKDGNGYGLTSMRERAEGLPGALSVASTPGAGTTVEVVW